MKTTLLALAISTALSMFSSQAYAQAKPYFSGYIINNTKLTIRYQVAAYDYVTGYKVRYLTAWKTYTLRPGQKQYFITTNVRAEAYHLAVRWDKYPGDGKLTFTTTVLVRSWVARPKDGFRQNFGQGQAIPSGRQMIFVRS